MSRHKHEFYVARDRRIESFYWSDGGRTLEECANRFRLTRESIKRIIVNLEWFRKSRPVNGLEGEYWQRYALDDETTRRIE